MEAKEGVNHINRRRKYGARDKEELIELIIKYHDKGLSQVEIANMLSINRGTIRRWNDEPHFFNSRLPGEAGKLKSRKYNDDENYFETIIAQIRLIL